MQQCFDAGTGSASRIPGVVACGKTERLKIHMVIRMRFFLVSPLVTILKLLLCVWLKTLDLEVHGVRLL